MADILRDYEKQRKDEAVEKLKNLLPQLKELKITKITVHYSGSGDEGAYDAVVFKNADDTHIEVLKNIKIEPWMLRVGKKSTDVNL